MRGATKWRNKEFFTLRLQSMPNGNQPYCCHSANQLQPLHSNKDKALNSVITSVKFNSWSAFTTRKLNLSFAFDEKAKKIEDKVSSALIGPFNLGSKRKR